MAHPRTSGGSPRSERGGTRAGPPGSPGGGSSSGGPESPPGWRVEPAPDGRGGPPQQKPPMLPRNRRGPFLPLIPGWRALTPALASITGGPRNPTRVPYEPFFLDQVKAGNVQE